MIHLIPHTQAADRPGWVGDDDLRPLSDIGRDQAMAIARVLGAVDAAYSSPARRCLETVAPLVVSGIELVTLDELREHQPGESFGDVAARMFSVLSHCRDRHPPQEVVAVCSHGDAIPITVAALVARHGLEDPPRIDRGGWYELDFGDTTDDDVVHIEARGTLLNE
ncbi:MAG TPA: histidine phosphatase family protein [Acidimicrobiales bacterium]|nr:histidine phosphatase family protein [Acidimicrobiales bacterium]